MSSVVSKWMLCFVVVDCRLPLSGVSNVFRDSGGVVIARLADLRSTTGTKNLINSRFLSMDFPVFCKSNLAAILLIGFCAGWLLCCFS